jgi:ABC-type multidrug transport system fused ATPase/permease subunit
MNLLCRFYDTTGGEVLVDGINVKDLDLYELRDNIGMAMQDVFLFSDTIEGNIAYARPDCSFEDVKKAAIMARRFRKDMIRSWGSGASGFRAARNREYLWQGRF